MIVTNLIALIVWAIRRGSEKRQHEEMMETRQKSNEEMVELGLSVRWAARNLVCNGGDPAGDCFEWGSKWKSSNDHSWEKYQFSRFGNLVKYNTDEKYGRVDGKETLEPEDDAANYWLREFFPYKTVRIPTEAEFMELVEKCEWTWTKEGSEQGYRITGPSGQSIFLPAVEKMGDMISGSFGPAGFYWTNGLSKDPIKARCLCIDNAEISLKDVKRWVGGRIRFVLDNRTDGYQTAYRPYLPAMNTQPDVLDLGLSVRWADRNVDCSSPEEFGSQCNWGDPEGYKIADVWDKYKYYKRGRLIKYNAKVDYGKVDGWTTLCREDDFASNRIQEKGWRMPTVKEIRELKEKCVWVLARFYGQTGYKVTGPSGACIFIPVPEDGQYGIWSSSLGTDSLKAYVLLLSKDKIEIAETPRCSVQSVRAVK